MRAGLILMALACAAAAPAAAQEPSVYTLYRSNPVDRLAAEHVATFDTRQGAEANSETCMTVAGLLQAQPENDRRYWCRPGRVAGGGAAD